MPRSGSELLQVILHQNPNIYGSATSPLLEYQFAARQNIGLPEVRSQEPNLMQSAFIAMCKGMAEGYYEAVTDRPIICDKNRGWAHYYEWVEQWNPEPKIICMVRDLRCILSSMEKIYRKTKHLPVGTDDPQKIQNMTVAQRAAFWINTQPVGLALQRTLDLFQRDAARHMLFVRYEDLCSAPQETISKIYKFIGEPEFAHDFGNLKKEVIEDDSYYGVYGSHKVAAALKPVTKDYNEILGREISAGIRRDNAWYFEQFGY